MCSCSCTAATPAGTNACNLHLYVFLQAKDQAKTSMRKADDKAFTRVMQERVDRLYAQSPAGVLYPVLGTSARQEVSEAPARGRGIVLGNSTRGCQGRHAQGLPKL
jgi:hypothetical protein